MTERHGAIDIGTNSMHLVVAESLPDGGFDVLTTEKEMVRLGHGAGDMKQLTPEAIDRGIAALRHMVDVTESLGADVVAVATSAVREAQNAEEFLARARDEVGIEVEIISGLEEARIIHLGVLQALPVFDKRLVLVDIGGGSTEFLVGEGEDILESRSMRVGAIRLTERFFPDGAVTPDRVQACRRYVRTTLTPALFPLADLSPTVAIGSSGTISTIAAMAAAQRGETIRLVNGTSFDRTELNELVTLVTEWPDDKRHRIPGIDERRSDIIVGGCLLLVEAFQALGIDEMIVSSYALREGVLYDRFGASASTGPEHLADLRASNARRLANQLDPDAAHAFHTAKLAEQLFDATTAIHPLGAVERELLSIAAVLHNVGLSINHSGHHKHSYYVIRHSEQLTGFTEQERELIALVARYHRKSRPRKSHPEFAALSPERRHIVRVLAGILRIAIGLDRRHGQLIESIDVAVTDEAISISPHAEPETDLDLELFSARERSQLLSQALDRRVDIHQPGAPM